LKTKFKLFLNFLGVLRYRMHEVEIMASEREEEGQSEDEVGRMKEDSVSNRQQERYWKKS
jgi:hypothetical protein